MLAKRFFQRKRTHSGTKGQTFYHCSWKPVEQANYSGAEHETQYTSLKRVFALSVRISRYAVCPADPPVTPVLLIRLYYISLTSRIHARARYVM